jgi:hypothetical protein
VGRIGARGADRADFRALLLGERADAFTAQIGVYFVYGAAFFYRLVRAFRFAGPATDAVVADFESHFEVNLLIFLS